MIEAIKKGDAYGVKFILQQNNKFDINKIENGETALHHAVYKGNYDIVESLLLAEKININKANKWGQTPLFLAAKNGRTNIVELLLKQKTRDSKLAIDINQTDDVGKTALHYAASQDYEMVKALLEPKTPEGKLVININQPDNGGYTPLHYAVEAYNTNITELLLTQKTQDGKLAIDINQVNYFGDTALHLAATFDMVNLLLKQKDKDGNYIIDFNIANNHGQTALYKAVSKGKFEIVKLLLEQETPEGKPIFDINQANKNGTVLKVALIYNNDNMIKSIITQKDKNGNYIIDFNHPDHRDIKLFYWVVRSEQNEILQLLLNQKKDDKLLIDIHKRINEPDKQGYTALHYAVDRGNFGMLELLLKQKDNNNNPIININQADKSGRTALYSAISAGRVDIVKFLLEQKDEGGKPTCDVNKANNNGRTALQSAVGLQNVEIVKLLLEQKDEDGKPTCDINKVEHVGHTALHYAAENGNFEIAKLLLAQKDKNGIPLIDVNHVTQGGNSAMTYGRGNEEIRNLLRQHGAMEVKVQEVQVELQNDHQSTHSSETTKTIGKAVSYAKQNFQLNTGEVNKTFEDLKIDIKSHFTKLRDAIDSNKTPEDKKNQSERLSLDEKKILDRLNVVENTSRTSLPKFDQDGKQIANDLSCSGKEAVFIIKSFIDNAISNKPNRHVELDLSVYHGKTNEEIKKSLFLDNMISNLRQAATEYTPTSPACVQGTFNSIFQVNNVHKDLFVSPVAIKSENGRSVIDLDLTTISNQVIEFAKVIFTQELTDEQRNVVVQTLGSEKELKDNVAQVQNFFIGKIKSKILETGNYSDQLFQDIEEKILNIDTLESVVDICADEHQKALEHTIPITQQEETMMMTDKTQNQDLDKQGIEIGSNNAGIRNFLDYMKLQEASKEIGDLSDIKNANKEHNIPTPGTAQKNNSNLGK